MNWKKNLFGPRKALNGAAHPEGFRRWYKTNIWHQKQEGYATATITLPLGDITADQLRAVADIARRFTNGTIRTTVDQNIVLRWISEADLPEVYAALESDRTRSARRGHDRRHHLLPRHGYLQAWNFRLAWVGRGTASAARGKESHNG